MKTLFRPLVVSLSLLLTAMALVSCDSQQTKDSAEAANSPAVSNFRTLPARADDAPNEDLKEFYRQKISWEKCGKEQKFDGYCAKVDIPINYDDPGFGKSFLSLGILPSLSENPRGTIFINPGGPGGSGMEALQASDGRYDQLLSDYHILGFDPRGVGSSDPIRCYDDQKTDDLRAGSDNNPATPEGLNATIEEAKELAETCKRNSGSILEFMDTVGVTKDLDLLRALVGDEKLNYLGYSYGTQIGARYTALFPHRTGKVVLDGAVNPDLAPEALIEAQTAGFQKALENYLQFCLTESKTCPFNGTVQEAINQLEKYIDRLKTRPLLGNDDRLVTDATFITGIITPLYDNQYWPQLTNALERIMKKNDPSVILLFSDFQAGRESNGTYKNNSYYAFNAVSCLDNIVEANPQQMSAQANELKNISPVFGNHLSYSNITCANWAYPPRHEPYPETIDAENPLLIIGTTDDPATPYQWSEQLQHKINNSVLVTFQGEGHTAFGRNSCINSTVNQYFLNDVVPDTALQCE